MQSRATWQIVLGRYATLGVSFFRILQPKSLTLLCNPVLNAVPLAAGQSKVDVDAGMAASAHNAAHRSRTLAADAAAAPRRPKTSQRDGPTEHTTERTDGNRPRQI
jgi:hypothetical protein